jgi:hypothetical protein
MSKLKNLLGQETLDAFMRGLVRGRYQALLGAGASMGGTSGDGNQLPDASTLAEELTEVFNLPSARSNDLRRLYAAAKGRVAKNGVTLEGYLKARFTNTVPPVWMKYLVQIPWAQLWTLNIDDCVERAYTTWNQQARKRINSISWTERHRTASAALDELLLVHLHGKASRVNRGNEVVFDIRAYVNATLAQYRWHKIFGDTFPEEPFLIVGASLDSEFDLQVVLEQGRITTSGDSPSILVSKTISGLENDEYRRYGLIPIESEAEEFFSTVIELFPKYLAEVSHEDALAAADTPPELYTFLSQWRPLEMVAAGPSDDRRHDFYAGHEPKWRDILLNLPAERAKCRTLIESLGKELSVGQNSIVTLAGEAFTGKSTVLLDVAKGLIKRGFRPFIYAGETSPDVRSTLWWIQRHPQSVLLIDDASDFAHEVEEIARRTEDSGLSLRALVVGRINASRHIENVLLTVRHESVVLGRSLTSPEVGRLVDKLAEKRRLGIIRDKDRQQRVRYFNDRGREIFSAMAELESGRGFVSRIMDEFETVRTLEARRLLGSAAILSDLGYQLPVSMAKLVSGLTPADMDKLIRDGELADLVTAHGAGSLRLRHRRLGTLLVTHCIDKDFRFELANAIAKALAPHISPAAISAGTLHYRMARALMGAATLRNLFKDDVQMVLDWYESVQLEYDWNARYWEQRALAASEFGLFEPAYSWAREAVARHEDAYTLNTVGTVLMRRALSEATEEYWPTITFEMAETSLAEARELEGSNSEYPYETFFRHVGRLVEKVKVRDRALNDQLRNLWLNWHVRVLSLDSTCRARLNNTLDSARRSWVEAGMEQE